MNELDEQKILTASEIVVRERFVSLSLLQRELKIDADEAEKIVAELATRGIVEEPNPNGQYHVALSLLARSEGIESAHAVHVRRIHDLALYMLENHGHEDTVCVDEILAEPFKTKRAELRDVVGAAMGSNGQESLFDVAKAIARLPTFAAVIPFEQIEQELQVACSATKVNTKWPNPEGRRSGLLHAVRYLKLRILERIDPHSRAVEAFVHESLLPHGRAFSKTAFYREHVVPCWFVQAKATELLRHGIPEWAVAEWVEPYLRIVFIETTDAKQLDGPLKLQTVMPKDWQFGRDCIYARLHVLSIEFTPPLEGPKCTCTPENLRDWALLRNVAKPST